MLFLKTLKTRLSFRHPFIRIVIFTSILFVAMQSTTLKAEENVSIMEGYSLTIGASVKQLDFDYYRSVDDDDPAGSMTEGMYVTYLIRAGSPYNLSQNKKWGYYFETSFSSFSMSKQNVDDEEKNLGTSVKGHSGYITPIGFFLLGPLPRNNKNKLSLLTGVGIGLGYLSAKGNMLLTEDGSNELFEVDENGFDLAVSLLLEAHYGHWMSRIYGAGPLLDSGESTYSVFDFTWDFGYTYVF